MKTIALIQARMRSARLPGKVLAEIQGQPMLGHVVARASRAKLLSSAAVVTSLEPADDPIADFCAAQGIACLRGSETDVLDRFFQAAKLLGADRILRVTGDCPFIDPTVIDKIIAAFTRESADYASNVLVPSYPDGLDAELFTFVALEAAWREAVKPSEREHVTPYLRNSGKFRLLNVDSGFGPSLAEERWTVDDPADLEFARTIYAALGRRQDFAWEEVLALLRSRPDIRSMQGKALMNEGYYGTLYAQAAVGPIAGKSMVQSEEWLKRSAAVIPGGAQTFSKGLTQHIRGVSPIFLAKGKGCRVWDVDGNEYIDYIQGLLPNILGYAHPEVNAAVSERLAEGHSFSLPHPLEVELAERLTRLIPCAEMVRFGKNGSDATAGAVRIARAYTGRERIACCGYHGWQDWYIGSTSRHRGVPNAVRELTHPFPYNDMPALEKLLAAHAGEFAAVIMEPMNFTEPAPDYLESVKRLAQKHGAVLIYDEICTGFHFGLGGAQKRFGVMPDLACFGKAMGNGFPIACVVGRAEIMRICEDIFFSFTFGGELGSIAAALKVLDILEGTDALSRMEANGRRLQDGFNALAKLSGLQGRMECVGRPTWSLLKFRDEAGVESLLQRSLWQQEVVKRGILQLVTHNLTAAHDAESTDQTLEAYASVFKTLALWLSDKTPDRFLEGPLITPIFRVR